MNEIAYREMAGFINHCAQEAGHGRSKLDSLALDVPGMTSLLIKHFINNLCSQGASYLEIGSLMGATAVAASYGNSGPFYAIDNYCQWPIFTEETCKLIQDWNRTHHLIGRNIRSLWDENVHGCGCNATLIEADCMKWDIPPDLQVDIFYYDEGHSTAETKLALQKYIPALKPGILLVDDYNDAEVQAGVAQAEIPTVYTFLHHKEWNGFATFIINGDYYD